MTNFELPFKHYIRQIINSKNMKKTVLFIALLLIITSCGSIKSSLKNVDNNAPEPILKNKALISISNSFDNEDELRRLR